MRRIQSVGLVVCEEHAIANDHEARDKRRLYGEEPLPVASQRLLDVRGDVEKSPNPLEAARRTERDANGQVSSTHRAVAGGAADILDKVVRRAP